MHDPWMAVAALARELEVADRRSIELRSDLEQPLDRSGTAAYHAFDRRSLRETAADVQRVSDVRVERIGRAEDGRHSALRIERVALAQLGLGQHRDRRTAVGGGESRSASADSGADDEDVEPIERYLAEGKRDEVPVLVEFLFQLQA
jgi:hypothetical protein